MNWYPWLTTPYKQLIEHYASGQGHHALLLYTPQEYGEELLANAVGRWLMCQQPQGEKICGQCRGCQLMSVGNHPDWYEMLPEGNKSTLGVEQIRQLTDKLYEHAQQGGAKVVWLPHAELLTDAAANALLKTLEEPPQNTYFILNCYEPQKLLATIRSRCLYWPLTSPDDVYGRQWLNRHYPNNDEQSITTALRLSAGSPLKAYRLLAVERWSQRIALFNALNEAIDKQDLLLLLSELNQDNAPEKLSWLIALFMDVMKWRVGAELQIVNQDSIPLLERLATIFSSDIALQKTCQQWLTCYHQLLSIVGINKELVLTHLLVSTERDYF